MPNRRSPRPLTASLLVALVVVVILLTGCGGTAEPASEGASASPGQGGSSTASPGPGATDVPALSFGETATVAGFELTPMAVRTRKGPVYDTEGTPIEGRGLVVRIEVAKTREADLSSGELTVPVAALVGASGATIRMDDFFGMVAADAQSDEYNGRYAESYQYACIQPPGRRTTADLWFTVPKGARPTQLVIDGGAGQQAAWILD